MEKKCKRMTILQRDKGEFKPLICVDKLERWIKLLRKSGIGSKQIVLKEMEELMDEV